MAWSVSFAPMMQTPRELVIRPSPAWRTIDLAEVWRYRELLYFFVWRDVKVRYKQTSLGILWALLQPLTAMIIFAFIFGRVVRVQSDGIPYPLFSYVGLLPWTFFSGAFLAGSQSLLTNTHLITKVYFPRILVPVSSVAAVLFDFLIQLVLVIPLMLWYKRVPSPGALFWAPLTIVVALLLALGFSIWVSALIVRYRDLRHAISFLVQIWMFATPIVYPMSMVPEKWRPLIALNPMAGVVEAFRRSVFGQPVPVMPLLWAAAVAVVMIVTGSIYFRRIERMVADVV